MGKPKTPQTDLSDDHFSPENTRDGVHACSDMDCMVDGVPTNDLHHIGFALSHLGDALEGAGVTTGLFRDEDGLYILLLIDGAILGAVYTPTFLEDLRDKGYTSTVHEAKAGLN